MAQTGAERHGALKRRTLDERGFENDAQPLNAGANREEQIAAAMRDVLSAGCLPQAERLAGCRGPGTGRANAQQIVSVVRPLRIRVERVDVRIFYDSSTPNA